MKKILLIVVPILLIAGFILFFRPSKGIDKNLVLAEQLMNDRPDSALQILEKMKVSNLGGENRALYALLMTQAQFKNRKPVESDSLIKVAYEYYVPGDDSLRKAQTYFYQGRVDENLGKKDAALKKYQKASISVLQLGDYSFLALIYNRWGLLLRKEHDYKDALDIQNKSLEYSIQCKDTLKQIFILKEIGKIYFAMQKQNKALLYFEKGLHLAELINNDNCISDLCNSLGLLFKSFSKYDVGMFYMNRSISLLTDSTYIYPKLLIKGNLFSLQQQYDSARYYLNFGRRKDDMASEASYNLFMSQLEEKLGNYQKSLEFSNRHIDYIFKILNADREKAIAELQKKYDYSLVKNENIQLELQNRNRDLIILSILIVSILIIWYISYRYNRIRHEKDEIIKEGRDQLEQMADALIEWEMRLKAVKLKSKEELDAFIKWVLSKNEAMRKIERLAKMDTCEIIAHKDELKLTPSEIENLKEVVDICFDGFATRLAHNFPSISEENIQFSCLMRMKIPASSIAVLLGVTDGTLVKRKYRFKKDMNEIIEGFSSLENFLLNF